MDTLTKAVIAIMEEHIQIFQISSSGSKSPVTGDLTDLTNLLCLESSLHSANDVYTSMHSAD